MNGTEVIAAPSDQLSNKADYTKRVVFEMDVQEEASADYDVNPTLLYTSIENRDWEAVLKRIVETPAEAATWIFRNEPDGCLRWRLLPIHAAVIFKAPDSIIEGLVDVFPEGSGRCDDQGMLPLHLAFRNGATDRAVHELLKSWPNAIHAKDNKGRLPINLHNRYVLNAAPEAPPLSPTNYNTSNRVSGFETYVSIAVKKEADAVFKELSHEFSVKISIVEDKHRDELKAVKDSTRIELANSKSRVKELEELLKAATARSAEVMRQYQAKCDDEESVRNKLKDTEKNLQNVIQRANADIEKLQEKNTILVSVAAELKVKTQNIERSNSSLEKRICKLTELLTLSQEKGKRLGRKLFVARKASGVLLAEYREKCGREVELQNLQSDVDIELKKKMEDNAEKTAPLLESVRVLETTVNQLKAHNKELDSACVNNRREMANLKRQSDKIAFERDDLRSNLIESKQVSRSLSEELNDTKKQVRELSRQLVAFDTEQEMIMQAAADQEEQMNFVMEERERLLQLLSSNALDEKLGETDVHWEGSSPPAPFRRQKILKILQDV